MYERDYVYILDDDPDNPQNVTSDFSGDTVPEVDGTVTDIRGGKYSVDRFSAVTGSHRAMFVHLRSFS